MDIVDWAEQTYFRLERPYRVHNEYRSPSWLDRFSGPHPPQAIEMMNDVLAGRTAQTARDTEDVEWLLGPLVVSGRARVAQGRVLRRQTPLAATEAHGET